MKFEKQFLTNPITRPALRNPERYNLKEVRAFVLHWTGNKNKSADADNNRNYFNHSKRYASAKIIVDDKQVIQTMPLMEVEYAVGGKKYTDYGKELMRGYRSPNYCTISVEVCVNESADFAATYANTLQVFASLLLMFPDSYTDKITTHHQITGKDCPQFPDEQGNFHLIEGSRFADFLADVEQAFWDMGKPIPFQK